MTRPRELLLRARNLGAPHAHAAWTAVKNSHWKRWDREKKRLFFLNLCVGIIVAAAFQIISRGQLMEKSLDAAIDKFIQKETSSLLTSSKRCVQGAAAARKDCEVVQSKFSQKIVFIDIDHDTYVAWQEPLLMPRDKLAHFLGLAEKNGARVVILDVLFDYPSPIPAEDRALRKVLEEMTRNSSPVHVIFPTLTSRVDGTLKKSVFDDLIARNPNFHRGLPYVAFSQTDRVVRYLRYYDIVKDRDGKSQVLWSTPVLSVVLFTGDAAKLASLQESILRDLEQKKSDAYTLRLSSGGTLDIYNREIFSNRIRFSLIPPGVLDSQGNLFTERILPDELDAMQTELRDKIVVVGTSSADKEGWYPTPVGDMPGMYVIGNGINMMLGDWQVRDAPLWVGITLQGFIIIFTAFMLINFKQGVVHVVSVILIVGLLSPATYYFYRTHGIFINSPQLFFNALMPVLCMGWHKVFKKKKDTQEKP